MDIQNGYKNMQCSIVALQLNTSWDLKDALTHATQVNVKILLLNERSQTLLLPHTKAVHTV